MGSYYLTDLADVCRAAGLSVTEVDGWPTRARGSGGYNTGSPNHVMVHHTASGPSSDGWPDVNYCTYGDSDAPLCNLYLGRSGQVWVCAGGATNTNGSGQDPCGATADDSMNSAAIGIEAGNDGQGEHWADAQLGAYTRLCSALCEHYGIPTSRIHAHFEWTSRKVDPAGPDRYATGSASWDMDRFRADCDGSSGPTPQPPEDDDVKAQVIKGDGSDSYYAWDGVTCNGIPSLEWVQWGCEAGLYANSDPVVYPQGFVDQLVESQGER
jgi:hypothetical protein